MGHRQKQSPYSSGSKSGEEVASFLWHQSWNGRAFLYLYTSNDSKSQMTDNMKLKDWEFKLLGFVLAFTLKLLIRPPFLCIIIGMLIL